MLLDCLVLLTKNNLNEFMRPTGEMFRTGEGGVRLLPPTALAMPWGCPQGPSDPCCGPLYPECLGTSCLFTEPKRQPA
jgi:hypothetical protein